MTSRSSRRGAARGSGFIPRSRTTSADVLMHGYASEFTAEDDVCLVVKDFGTGSFYRGQTAGAAIETIRARSGAPEVLYLDETLDAGELAGLYRACDCLVSPYRGEGF